MKELDEEVIRVKKHDETRREYMTLSMELKKFKEEGREEGREEGIEFKNKKVIMKLFGMKMSIDYIAEAVEESLEYVEQVIRQSQREHQ